MIYATQIKYLVIFATIISLIGCAKTESENVKTSGISAYIKVTAEGNGSTDVYTSLKVGSGIGGTALLLSSGDTLLAYANSITKVMSENDGLLSVSYDATFPFDDEGTEFRVEFNRSEDVSAPNSVVTLPAAFSITDSPDVTYAKDAVVSVNWEPAYSPDNMTIEYFVDCIDSGGGQHTAVYTVNTIDNGQRDITVTEILANASPGFSDSSNGCTLKITVSRNRLGIIDPNYGEGGVISSVYRRSINANIAP
jgi:hypothetical protein